jgi:hypothetical protein
MGEGMIIGILDADITTTGHINANSKAEGMSLPPVKWKGRYDNNQACNNKLIGFKTFVDTSDTRGNSLLQRASVLGIEYDKAFVVAPKAHLVVYHVCDEECHPKEVRTGMDSTVDDGVDVISMSFNGTKDNTVFHDDVVTTPSYSVVAQCVLVCTRRPGATTQTCSRSRETSPDCSPWPPAASTVVSSRTSSSAAGF